MEYEKMFSGYKGSFQTPLNIPNFCVCCMGQADTEVLVSKSLSSTIRAGATKTTTRREVKTPFPICSVCKENKIKNEGMSGSAVVRALLAGFLVSIFLSFFRRLLLSVLIAVTITECVFEFLCYKKL